MKKLILSLLSILYLNIFLYAQNVGIGTTTPLEKLSVVSVSGYGISHESSSIKLSTYIDGSGAYIGTITNNPFHLYTNNGAAQFTLLQNGNVGIGNINPQYKLDFAGRMRVRTGSVGNIFTSSGIWMDDYRDGNTRIFFGMQDSIRLGIWGDGTPGAGWGFNFNARNGNVGIGITNPTNKLEVNGNISSTGTSIASTFQYNTPKTYYYSLGGVDFRPVNNTDNFEIHDIDGSVNMINSSNALIAPVHLPHGAVVVSFFVYLHDSNLSQNLEVKLFRSTGSSNAGLFAVVTSSGAPGNTLLTFSPINITVNNFTEFYYVLAIAESPGIWPDNSLAIQRILINYTLPGPQ